MFESMNICNHNKWVVCWQYIVMWWSYNLVVVVFTCDDRINWIILEQMLVKILMVVH